MQRIHDTGRCQCVSLSNYFLFDSVFIFETRYHARGIITWQVYDEISAGMSAYPRLKSVDKLIDGKSLQLNVLTRPEQQLYLQLIGHLGKGEASCIALASVQGAVVVTDDRTARKQCTQMSISFTGTVGILKASLLDGLITLAHADEILDKMVRAGFYSPVRRIADIS